MLLPVTTKMQIMHIYQSAVTHLNLQSVLRITKYHKPESTSRSPVRYQTQTVLFTLVPMLTMITAFSLMFISTMLLMSYFFCLVFILDGHILGSFKLSKFWPEILPYTLQSRLSRSGSKGYIRQYKVIVVLYCFWFGSTDE